MRHSPVQEECSGPPLIPAGLRGYRCWNVWFPTPVKSSIGLYALTGPAWEVTLEARCKKFNDICDCSDCWEKAAVQSHRSPHAPCSCGIYGYHDPLYVDSFPVGGIGFIGVIEASGRTLVGTKGFRAEKARVIAVAPWIKPTLSNDWVVEAQDMLNDSMDRMRKAGIEVYPTFQDVVESYPPEDYEGMIANLREGTDG